MDRSSVPSTSSFDEFSSDEVFQSFKEQLKKARDLIEGYQSRMVDNSLSSEDLTNMKNEMDKLTSLNEKLCWKPGNSNYVRCKTMYLKIVQDSYSLCDFMLNKEYKDEYDVFSIESFFNKIIEACDGKEDPLDHIIYLFRGVFRNTTDFGLNFLGNFQSTSIDDTSTTTKIKRSYKRSQKPQLEELVVPEEVEGGMGDDEAKMCLKKVHRCLIKAVSNNNGNPICFYKFAIDPISLTFTIENLHNLAILVRDGLAKIESEPGHEENKTITVVKNKNKINDKENVSKTFFSMNIDLWQSYKKKYNITERMIEQNE